MTIYIDGNVTIQGNVSTVQTNVAVFNTAGTYSWTSPANIVDVQVLLVGGGGSGGQIFYTGNFPTICGGGGGAGGLIGPVDITANVTPNTTYSIVVGQGGNVTALGTNVAASVNGNASVAFGLTAQGGGGGGYSGHSAASGGSGGGAPATFGGNIGIDAYDFEYNSTGGANVSNQGSYGGNGAAVTLSNVSYGAAGGGGGAGDPGGLKDPSSSQYPYAVGSGAGAGDGIYSTITGANVYYAQGGQGAESSVGWSYVSQYPFRGIMAAGNASPTAGGGGGGGLNAQNNATNGQTGIVVIKTISY